MTTNVSNKPTMAVFANDYTSQNDADKRRQYEQDEQKKKDQADKDAQDLEKFRAAQPQALLDAADLKKYRDAAPQAQLDAQDATKYRTAQAQMLEGKNNLDPAYHNFSVMVMAATSHGRRVWDSGDDSSTRVYVSNVWPTDNKFQYFSLQKTNPADNKSPWYIMGRADNNYSLYVHEDDATSELKLSGKLQNSRDQWYITMETAGWWRIVNVSTGHCIALPGVQDGYDAKNEKVKAMPLDNGSAKMKQLWHLLKLEI